MRSVTVFVSWTCYGRWLHGSERGSVVSDQNVPETPWLPPDPVMQSDERERMTQSPYSLDAARRIVLIAIREVCAHRGWTLHAVHVRATHVHAIVSGEHSPERMLNDFKAYASRALNAAGLDALERKRWTRHGSTRYINKDDYLAAAINYVLNKQGEPMERWPEDAGALPNGRGSLNANEPRP